MKKEISFFCPVPSLKNQEIWSPIISADCFQILKKLCFPFRFSGITKEKLQSVTKTLEQVRQELFKFIFKDTILIGHSLENDLKALKVRRNFVIFENKESTASDFGRGSWALKKIAFRKQCWQSKILRSSSHFSAWRRGSRFPAL